MILDRIQGPEDLRDLRHEDLRTLAGEIRELIITTVAANGGHLASNLGVVELTIALHRVFNAPKDKIIWDVGHQAYCHKLLTGRRDRFPSIRTDGGISGFPKRDESEYDAFGTGHSSTSISAALGILAGRPSADAFRVIAVIGDGALSGGLAFEGLNNAGDLKKDLIVILNDNEMSISPNVGALSAYMNRILTGEFYRRFKKETKAFLENIPRLGQPVSKMAQKAEEMIKGLLLPGIWFEEMGFDYVGPIDGHNIELLIDTLGRIKTATAPTLVHVITRKGKGYEFSEKDPCVFHGIGPFEPETGSPLGSPGGVTYSESFGRALTDLAVADGRIIAITAAMKEGTGLDCFAQRFPDRFYDVGIAEPHAVTFAAGLATQGMRPVFAVYSTFLQRAYDQIIHDVCLQRLPVVFAIDRAGIVGEDGPTHNGLFDISYLRHIPDLTVMAPADGVELELMLKCAIAHDGPSAVRYPRGRVPQPELRHGPVELGRSEVLRDGSDVAIFALGSCVLPAVRAAERLAAEGINVMVVNARFVKPLDRDCIMSVAARISKIITVEENVVQGGFGGAVVECLSDGEAAATVRRLGIPDRFVEQGGQERLRARYGIDEAGIAAAVRALMNEPTYRS